MDIGCGSGGIAAAIAPHVRRMIGVDPEPWVRWQNFGAQHANLEFHVGSYRDLENLLGGDSIDVVICNQVYEHVDDPDALLASIHRVLKDDGVCYFAGPNLLWPIEPHVFWPFVHWLPRRFAQRAMHLLGSRRANELDAWSWSYWRLVRAFRRAGFACRAAIRARVQAQAMLGGSSVVRVVASLPLALYTATTPITPAFVFVLRKAGVTAE
ncbi:MAG TPA: class I SAM-dependent methyltransferase [Rhodanobacteraceae bacterium]|nr:class I SAM-dependent methyltransferase [Rhodanobacteraceae bacterium]